MAHLNRMARFPRTASLLAALALVALPLVAHAQNTDDDDDAPAKPAESSAAPDSKPADAAEKKPVVPAGSKAAPPSEDEKSEGEAARPERARTPALTAEQGYLEGRAEVESPNEAIHTVQKKAYTAAHRFELTLYPAALQLNSKFTNIDGVALAVGYALQENFALQIMGFYNYVGSWSPLTGQLLDLHARPEAADQLILQAGAVGGFEVAPIFGKFAFYDGTLAQFRFVLNAGAGIGSTEVQLSGSTSKFPTNETSDASSGLRFLGNLGVGFRVLLGDRFALRLEVRDLLYTARVDTIDGCNAADLANLAAASSGCNRSNFTGGTTQQQQTQQTTARTVAGNLLSDNSSDVVNNVIFFGGVSFLF